MNEALSGEGAIYRLYIFSLSSVMYSLMRNACVCTNLRAAAVKSFSNVIIEIQHSLWRTLGNLIADEVWWRFQSQRNIFIDKLSILGHCRCTLSVLPGSCEDKLEGTFKKIMFKVYKKRAEPLNAAWDDFHIWLVRFELLIQAIQKYLQKLRWTLIHRAWKGFAKEA